MIFVTGASGNIGTAVVKSLSDRQVPCRIGARKPHSITSVSNAEIVRFDFLETNTFRAAVQGCHAVFLLRPPAIANTQATLNRFIDVAREEGVKHFVFISVAGAGDNPAVPHHATEQHLRRSSEDWTILRPGFFAQNLGDAYREEIVQRDRIFVPAGSGRVAFIDTRDIAEVAANILIHPASHQGKIYTLTGAEALTFSEVARILSDELERKIVYEPASVLGYALHLFRHGLPLEQVIVLTILHVGLRFGQAEAIDETLPKLLNHRPHSLQNYVKDYRELWLKPL